MKKILVVFSVSIAFILMLFSAAMTAPVSAQAPTPTPTATPQPVPVTGTCTIYFHDFPVPETAGSLVSQNGNRYHVVSSLVDSGNTQAVFIAFDCAESFDFIYVESMTGTFPLNQASYSDYQTGIDTDYDPDCGAAEDCFESGASSSVNEWTPSYPDYLPYTGDVAGRNAFYAFDASSDPFAMTIFPGVMGYPEEESPPDPPMPFAGTCLITSTVVLTDSQGVTSTQVIVTEVDSNLVANHSFETGDGSGYLHAENWIPSQNGQANYSIAPYRYADGEARSGSYAIADTSSYQLWGDGLTLYEPGQYLGGFYAKCTGGSCNNVDLSLDNFLIVSSSGLTNTYAVFSDTVSVGGGSPYVILSMYNSDDVRIDDVFVYPVDENGNLNCQAEFYGIDPGPVSDVDPVPDDDPIPAPTGGPAGVKCFLCARPTSLIQVGNWIAYLACIIKNLFSCSLRIWFINLGNWVAGLYNNFVVFLNWMPTFVSSAISWAGSHLSGYWAYVSGWTANVFAAIPGIPYQLIQNILKHEFVQSVWRFVTNIASQIEGIGLLIDAVMAIIEDLYLAVIEIIDMLRDLFMAIRDAFTTNAYQITVITDEGEVNEINPAELYADGPNLTKILWIFLAAVSSIDHIIGLYAPYTPLMLLLAVGTLALGTVMWTMKLWHDILPV